MKNKYLLIFPIVLLFAFGLWFLYDKTPFSLLSPLLLQIKPPDLTDKLGQKISTPPTFNYESSIPLKLPSEVSYLLYNPLTGKVYSSHNQDLKISPASFTKLMTASVALDLTTVTHLISATPDSINKEPTILGLKLGEQLSVDELIKASISTSANDAAATLAEGVAAIYGQKAEFFVAQMNKKASLLNLQNTNFANPEGYDHQDQYSTLEDIALLVHNVKENYPEIIKAGLEDREDLLATTTHGFYYLPNWNTLLGLYPGVNGLKIAYTQNAGYGTIITANRNNLPVNLILTGAKTLKERDLYAAQLLDFAYSKHNLTPVNLTEKNLQTRYDVWNNLARQIRAELDALKD